MLLAICSLGSCYCSSTTSESFELLVPTPQTKSCFYLNVLVQKGELLLCLGTSYWETTEDLTAFLCTCAHMSQDLPENSLGEGRGWGGVDTDTNQNSEQGSVYRLHFLCWGLSFLTICWMAHFWVLDLSQSFLFPEPNHSVWNLPEVQCIKMYTICVW